MCGIFGFISDEIINYQTFYNLSKTIKHRGPDAHAVFFLDDQIKIHYQEEQELESKFQNRKSFIGHHRLSIIDINERANQPFSSNCGRYTLVFNGEIYNYIELRNELKSNNIDFKTKSDTEVLLYSLILYGSDILSRLNGDFSFALYDNIERTLLLARDRTGIKPLFYSYSNNQFVFSSELKALTKTNFQKWTLNDSVIFKYLTSNFPIHSNQDLTFINEIKSIKPGHTLKLNIDNLTLKEKQYFNLKRTDKVSLEDSIVQFKETLNDAVKIRTRSDVPLASFLSGGLDSSSICALAKDHKKDLYTFSTIFKDSILNEEENINLLRSHLLLDGSKTYFTPSDFFDELEDFIYLQDQPFMTLNVYSQYKNIKSAKEQGYKVLLDGGGADEILAGYKDYYIPFQAAKSSHKNSEKIKTFQRHTSKELNNIRTDKEKFNVNYLTDQFRKRISENVVDRPLPTNYKDTYHGSYLLHSLKESIFSSWMNKNLFWDNRYLDLNGMALGVEVRVPFQDYRLIDIALNLEDSAFIKDSSQKMILRKSMQGKLPDKIIHNNRKIGFEFPFCQLIREDKTFFQYINEIINLSEFEILMKKYIDIQKVKEELTLIKNNKSQNYNIWRVINLFFFIKNIL